MSPPLTDEQLAGMRQRVERARAGGAFAWRPTVDDIDVLLAEIERLKVALQGGLDHIGDVLAANERLTMELAKLRAEVAEEHP